MTIPNKQDWVINRESSLDEENAKKTFYGLSLSEAEVKFEENALNYQEDLMWMPIAPFQFYIKAYVNYLKSKTSAEDADAASCFLNLIDFKLDYEKSHLKPILETIRETVEYIGENQKKFDAEVEIYGNFKSKSKKILQRLDDNKKYSYLSMIFLILCPILFVCAFFSVFSGGWIDIVCPENSSPYLIECFGSKNGYIDSIVIGLSIISFVLSVFFWIKYEKQKTI